jgi:polyhydroxyalkanoate synthesis regulator phasin
MTTLRQLIQTSPARVNELFARLVDTSETAVKTREKLFAELKGELELFADLEEQHLFPVMRKHKELKDLVREALNDNKATRKLLTELDHTPKDNEEFPSRVGELRRVFQQHVRDEKKELLPAVLKALSDEEAEAVVDRIEAGKAEIEEAKRAEAEERRAEARRQREKAEAEQARIDAAERADAKERRAAARQEREEAERVQEAAEAVADIAWTAPKAAEQAARAAEVVQTTVSTGSELAQRATDQVTEVLGAARQRSQDLTQRTSQSLQAVAETSADLARGLQDASGECVEMIQERLQTNLDGVNALVRCRTLPELLQAQGSLFQSNLELTLANSRRVAEISTRFVENANRTVTAQAEWTINRAA